VFCLGETAVDIEGVLKQAVLKHGLPRKLVVDNGPAYRAATLQEICARLDIRLIYCRPYAPEGKGKLERWHRTFRDQFLSELDPSRVADLDDLNVRLSAWIEQIYHRRPHFGLEGKTPIERFQQDLSLFKRLDFQADHIDAIFYHRIPRIVDRAGTVSYKGKYFEVPWELSEKSVYLVVDPHTGAVISVEDVEHNHLGTAMPLDAIANAHRRRRCNRNSIETTPLQQPDCPNNLNLVELAYQHSLGSVGQEVSI
jgi:hypothetical protein